MLFIICCAQVKLPSVALVCEHLYKVSLNRAFVLEERLGNTILSGFPHPGEFQSLIATIICSVISFALSQPYYGGLYKVSAARRQKLSPQSKNTFLS